MTASFETQDQAYLGTARYRIVVFTVAAATRLLERRRAAARRHATAVRAYALAMREQRWVLNGMPIILSRQGVLLDGYQRLLACVEAQTPFQSFLAEGVEEDACHSTDQQRRRSFATVLEARGIAHAHALQACLVKLIQLQQPGYAPSWAVLDRTLRANPDLPQGVLASFALAGCPLPEAVRSPLICIGYQINKELTDRLLDAVTHPEQYELDEPGVLLLHEIKRGAAQLPAREFTANIMALAIKALDATLRAANASLAGYAGLAPPAIAARFEPSSTAPAVSFAMEEVGPDLARQYLTQNTGNRRLSRPHVEALARDIAKDRWMFNAQPICFAHTGQVLNGQHRLHAVILAGRSIEVPVVRGLDPSAYETYDHHARRPARAGGEPDTFGDLALAAAMANLLWHHERKTRAMHNAKATAAEIQQIILEHPRLLVLRSFARRMGHFGRASVIGYAAYVMERDDAGLAAKFLAALETGADQRPGHPILALRGVLQKLRSDKAPQAEQLGTLLAAWERFKTRSHAL